MKLFLLLIISLAVSFPLEGRTAFEQSLLQVPTVDRPTRGSLTGDYAGIPLDQVNSPRAQISQRLPLEWPETRGPLGVDLALTWSSATGLTEWGMGWDFGLAIQRYTPKGSFRSEDDWLASREGFYQKGTDGSYYLQGFSQKNRLVFLSSDEFMIFGENGERKSYKAFAKDFLGRSTEWFLTRVVDRSKRETRLKWAFLEGERPRLIELTWAQRGQERPHYQLSINYETLQAPRVFRTYNHGYREDLKQRVTSMTVNFRDDQIYRPAWSYTFAYDDTQPGVAYYLTSVQQKYASGASKPPFRFSYHNLKDQLKAASLTTSQSLETILAPFGRFALSNDKLSFLDYNKDGLTDILRASDSALFIRDSSGYRLETVFPRATDARNLCRKRDDLSNSARSLLRVHPQASLVSFAWEINPANPRQTILSLCNFNGQVTGTATFDGALDPTGNTRVVDLNGDKRPDVIKLLGDRYQVWRNNSSESQVIFTFEGAFPLATDFSTGEYYYLDFNGDGFTDLVGFEESFVRVRYGLGDFRFATDEQRLLMFNSRLAPLGLTGFTPYVRDLNGDGAADVLLAKDGYFHVLINEGSQLVGIDLGEINRALPQSSLVIEDLMGLGTPQILQSSAKGLVSVVTLTQPGVGWLAQATDRSAVTMSYSWSVAPPSEGLSTRPIVIRRMTRSLAGDSDLHVDVVTGGPATDPSTERFLGFQDIRVEQPKSVSTRTYEHFPESSSQLKQEVVSSKVGKRLSKVKLFEFDLVRFQGVLWSRPTVNKTFYRTPAGSVSQPSWESFVYGNQNDPCLRGSTRVQTRGTLTHTYTYAAVEAFKDHILCWSTRESLVGSHVNAPEYDFHYELDTPRNDFGSVTSYTLTDSQGRNLRLQTASYDELNRLTEISNDRRQQTSLTYFQDTDRIDTLRDKIGVKNHFNYDWQDLLHEQLTLRGSHRLQEFYAYDSLNRLNKAWDSLSPSSEAQPVTSHDYRYPLERPGFFRSIIRRSPTSASDSVELISGLGLKLTEGLRIPEGWRLGPTLLSDQVQLSKELMSPSGTDKNPEDLTFEDLKGQGTLVERSEQSLWNEIISKRKWWQKDTVGDMSSAMAVDDNRLTDTFFDNGIESVTTKDEDDRIIRIQDPAKESFTYTYDVLGRLRAVVMPSLVKAQVEYDGFGRILKVSRGLIGSMSYEYGDADSLIMRKNYAQSNGIPDRFETMGYDEFGRMTRLERTKDGKSEVMNYSYDGKGLSGPIQDQLGFLSRVDSDRYQKSWIYRADGAVLQSEVAIPSFVTVRKFFLYDWNRQPSQVTTESKWFASGRSQTHKMTLQLDEWSRPKTLSLGSSVIATATYDHEGRLLEIDQSKEGRLSLSYDQTTQELNAKSFETDDKSFRWSWDYSSRGLITREDAVHERGASLRIFDYDDRGFLVQEESGKSISHSYDRDGLKQADDQRVRRDAMQRVVGTEARAYSFGPSGNWSEVKDDKGRMLAEFVYDEQGERLLKVSSNGTRWLWFGDVFVNESELIESVEHAGILIGFVRSGVYRSSQFDSRKTQIYNSNVGFSEVNAYGQRNPGNIENTELIDFAGKGYDPELGTIRMGARDYLPELGQFVSYDPLYFEQPELCLKSPVECNLYSYGMNNPLRYIDPSGFLSFDTTTPDVRAQLRGYEGYVQQGQLLGAATAVAVGGSIALGPGLAGGAAAVGRSIGAAATTASNYAGALTYRGLASISEAVTSSSVSKIGFLGLGSTLQSETTPSRLLGQLSNATKAFAEGMDSGSTKFLKNGGTNLLGSTVITAAHDAGVLTSKLFSSESKSSNSTGTDRSDQERPPVFGPSNYRDGNSTFDANTSFDRLN